MKYIKLNKLLILLALSFILVGCNKDNAETNKETISESENEIQESNKETETVKEEDKEKTENNDISKTILTNLSKLFEKFNANPDYKSSIIEITEQIDGQKNNEENLGNMLFDYNSLKIMPSFDEDKKYDVTYTNIIENNESSFEDFVNKFGDILKDNYDIDKKDFHDKIMEEFKNSNNGIVGTVPYVVNKKNILPASVQWMTKNEDKEISVLGNIPLVEIKSESKDGLFEIAYEYLNNSKGIIDKDKDLNYYLYQDNNKINYDGNLPDFSNMSPEEMLNALENNLPDLDMSPEESEKHLKENLYVRSTFYVNTLTEDELNEINLSNKNKEEVYAVRISVDGNYDLDLQKFIDKFDELTVNLPDTVKSKFPELNDAMKKQYEEKSYTPNSVIGNGFRFDSSNDILMSTDMSSYVTLYVDKDGNLVETGNIENKETVKESN